MRKHLVALDRETGRKLWEMSLYDAAVKGTPVFAQDTAFVGLGKTGKGNLLAVKMDGTILWYSKMGDGNFGSPAFSNGVVYGKGSDGYLYAVGNPLSFSATPVTGIAPLTVAFHDTTPQKTSGWSWDFGDGFTGTEQDPVHSYTLPGTYTVKLSASDASGTVSLTKERYITVNTNLTATALSPAWGVAGTTVPITISGGNFTRERSANLTRGAVTIPVTDATSADGTNCTGTLVIPGGAPAGLYDLSVTRASHGTTVKMTGTFRVLQYPAPIVTSIDPTSTGTGTPQRFTVIGDNFHISATVSFSSAAGTKIATTAVPINQTAIVLTATFPANGAGQWSVTVTNPDGGSATIQNALEVLPSNADTLPPTIKSVWVRQVFFHVRFRDIRDEAIFQVPGYPFRIREPRRPYPAAKAVFSLLRHVLLDEFNAYGEKAGIPQQYLVFLRREERIRAPETRKKFPPPAGMDQCISQVEDSFCIAPASHLEEDFPPVLQALPDSPEHAWVVLRPVEGGTRKNEVETFRKPDIPCIHAEK